MSEGVQLSDYAKDVFDQAQRIFRFPFSIEFGNARLSQENEFFPVEQAFISSINDAISLASIHYGMANQFAFDLAYRRILISERILAAADSRLEGDDVTERENDAHISARRKLENADPQLLAEIADDIAGYMKVWSDSAEGKSISQSLLRHSTIAVWNAIEVAFRDSVELLLNRNPYLSCRLLKSGHFAGLLKKINFQDLSEFRFDMSNSIGSYVVQRQDFSDTVTMKELASVIFPDKRALIGSLGSSELYHLSQTRHLIVHRGGVVDEKFLRNTNSDAETGTVIELNPLKFKGQCELVKDVGQQLLSACADSECQSDQEPQK